MTALAIPVLLVLLGAPPEELDTIWLKDGRKRTGIIVKETKEYIVLRIVLPGRKGQVGGTATDRIQRAEIKSIERMADAGRSRLKAKSEGLGTRRLRLEEALRAVVVTPRRLAGKPSLRAVGKHVEVRSTCDERFVRSVTVIVDQLFEAYRGNFGIEGEPGRRIRIYMFSDLAEYRGFQVQKFGSAIDNPAFYAIGPRYIAAYNMVQREEERRIRKEAKKVEREIRDVKKKIDDWEHRIVKEVAEANRKIKLEAGRAKRKIQGDGYAEKQRRYREVDKWQREQRRGVQRWRSGNEDELDAYKKAADTIIDKNRAILTRNARIRRDQNRVMFESLFHEAFHAFAHNHLWENGRRIVPRWLDEGLACYYEMSAVELDGTLAHGASNPDLARLIRDARRKNKLLPCEKIVRATPGDYLVMHARNAERSTLHYAQSWALAHYLVDKVGTQRMRAYVKQVTAGADPIRAFEKLMGEKLRVVEFKAMRHATGLK
ncbi:MAG: DUF1570 domain-containing protein [Planctomycetota bacterium]|jgi:hypothetical protein